MPSLLPPRHQPEWQDEGIDADSHGGTSTVEDDFDLFMRTVGTLNRSLLSVGESIAAAAGQTHARSACLQQITERPRTVAQIAGLLGTARQSVQRVADLLVEDGLASYVDNPRHRRAQLLALTTSGLQALATMRAAHHDWVIRAAARLEPMRVDEVTSRLLDILAVLRQVDATTGGPES
jgi:DNA-binding MarR family transcriptional regulator